MGCRSEIGPLPTAVCLSHVNQYNLNDFRVLILCNLAQ